MTSQRCFIGFRPGEWADRASTSSWTDTLQPWAPRTISFLAAEHPLQHLHTLPHLSHVLSLNMPSARVPKAKAPFVERWALMAPSWILSETNSMKVTVLGRNVHRETCWRSFWRAVAVRLLVSRCAGSQSTFWGVGIVQLLVCLLFWRYRSRT